MRTRRHNYLNPQPEFQQALQPQQAPQIPIRPVPQTPHPVQTPKPVPQPNDESEDLDKKLRALYDDITKTPSFSAKITDFLRRHDLHSKHRRIIKKKFPRRRVIARFPFDIFMGDLLEYPQYKTINRGYVYILLLIDCFTKKIYIAPMKKKDKHHAAEAFESIFKTFDEFPVHLITDGGKEFFNSSVNKIFHNYGINHYKTPTKTKWKASMAERAIQTIKNRLQKYFHKTGRNIWIDVAQQVVDNYNKTPHSAHDFPPQDVSNENRDVVYKKLYPNKNLTTVCRLGIGDKVRKLREKTDFEKGYTQKWSDEIFAIKFVRQSAGVCWYILEDHTKTELSGIWYYYQLNLVAKHVDQSNGDQRE